MNKVIKKVMNVLSTVLVVVVVILAVLLVGLKFVGLTPYTVLSGSMEPKYHVGSVIYVTKVDDPNTLQVGDPLTWKNQGVTVTHQIVEKGTDEKGLYFVTQGLGVGAVKDPKAYAEDILGKPLFSIPLLGYISNFIQNPPGTYITIAVCALLVIFCFLPDFLKPKKTELEEAEASTEVAAEEKA